MGSSGYSIIYYKKSLSRSWHVMNDKTFRVLEFQKVMDLVQEQARTILGKQEIEGMKPARSLETIQTLQNETDEAMHLIRQLLHVPFSAVQDVQPLLKRSDIGSMLFTEEVLAIGQLLYCGRNVKHFIEQVELDLPLLKGHVADVETLRHLEKDIFSKIDDHGEVVDDASRALYGIRQQIKQNETRIRERLQQYIRSKSKMLSDSIITIRNNRYVLPVKQEYRQTIGGIVHDQSSSGQTLFM